MQLDWFCSVYNLGLISLSSQLHLVSCAHETRCSRYFVERRGPNAWSLCCQPFAYGSEPLKVAEDRMLPQHPVSTQRLEMLSYCTRVTFCFLLSRDPCRRLHFSHSGVICQSSKLSSSTAERYDAEIRGAHGHIGHAPRTTSLRFSASAIEIRIWGSRSVAQL